MIVIIDQETNKELVTVEWYDKKSQSNCVPHCYTALHHHHQSFQSLIFE